MLSLFLTSVLIMMVIIGYGTMAERALFSSTDRMDITGKCILGMLMLSMLGMAFNFFIPLGTWLSAGLFVVGLVGMVVNYRNIYSAFGSKPAAMLGLLILLLIVYAAGAMRQDFMPDTGLYHVPALTWLHESPIALGAANLHSRLGYNTAWFPLAAVLRTPGIGLTGVFAINVVIYAVVIFGFLRHLKDIGDESQTGPSVSYVAILLVILIFSGSSVFYFQALGVSTDAPALLLVLYAFFLALKCLTAVEVPRSGLKSDVGLLWIVTVLAAIVKLSTLPLLLLPLYVHAVFRHTHILHLPSVRLAVVMALVFFIWMLRGVGLSGCLAFPQPQTCVTKLQWSVSKTFAADEAKTIRNFARAPGAPWSFSDSWAWLSGWQKRVLGDRFVTRSVFLLLGGLVVVSIVVVRLARDRTDNGDILRLLGVVAIALIGVVFWFFQGPEPRFGYGFMLASGSLLTGIGVSSLGLSKLIARHTKKWLLAGLIVSASLHGMYQLVRLPPGAMLDYGWPYIPEAIVDTRLNYQGRPLLIPESGLCWAVKGPCTPYYERNLSIDQIRIWPIFRSHEKNRQLD